MNPFQKAWDWYTRQPRAVQVIIALVVLAFLLFGKRAVGIDAPSFPDIR